MKGKLSFYLVVIGVFFCMAGCGGGGEKVDSYSAEQVHLEPDGKARGVFKVYGTPDKIRMEMYAPWGGGSMVNIIRKDKDVTWTLIPEKKVYMESTINEADMQRFMVSMDDAVGKEEDLGTEIVNGYKCNKKRIETTVKVMGFERTTSAVVWKSDEFPFPIRTQDDGGGISEMRNIKKGPQPDELFEIPSGYSKIGNLMEAMKRPM